jgi:threonine dehydrogenase-like Zn-dependent dehydrogenase
MHVLTIHGVNDTRLDPCERPEPGPTDVIVVIRACGICGSDLTYIKSGGIPPGQITRLGHESAGDVIAIGRDVKNIAIGQPVILNPMKTAGNVGNGGSEGAFTEELLVRDAELGENLLPMPAGVSYEVAAMCEPLAVALHGVMRANVAPGDKVVVFGCGPIGLGMVLWLVDRGVTDVVAVDLSPERCARAVALGAREAVDPTRVNLRDRLAELHGEFPVYKRTGVGTDAFIDAAGAPNILGDVVRMAKVHARMVITAVYSKPIELPAREMMATEMTITTAIGYPTEMAEVVAALPRLKDKIASLISHRMPFDRILEALDVAGTPQSAKVMIEFP